MKNIEDFSKSGKSSPYKMLYAVDTYLIQEIDNFVEQVLALCVFQLLLIENLALLRKINFR